MTSATTTSTATAALQRMLAGEHAAVYAYGVLGGRLTAGKPLQAAASDAYVAHRTRRDDLVALLRSQGVDPVVARAGYALPTPVDTPAQARHVARQVEDRCSVLYAEVVATNTGRIRAYAVDALIDAATRGLAWGADPVALPGVQRR